ncbi:hypothetical protein ABZ312_11560 [Streptomyces sp. NPDC006207]
MTQPAAPTCSICGNPATQPVHDGCRKRLDQALAELPKRYVDLEAALIPGRGGNDGGRRGKSLTPPVPLNLSALDLRARGDEAIIGIVTRWEDHVRDALAWSPRTLYGSIEQAIAHSVKFLRNNLPWICEQDPAAVKEFADDIARVHHRAGLIITGERGEMRIPLKCDGTLLNGNPCEAVLKVTISTTAQQCPRCGTQRDREQLFNLTPTRAAA